MIFAFLVAAGVVAGVVGTAGGITSLISYPALLATGISPFAANVTNAVSLIGSGLSSSLVSGLELRGHRANLRSWALLAFSGGSTGAVLLLVTPPGIFAWIVPFLIASASALLLAQPRIARLRGPAGIAADESGDGLGPASPKPVRLAMNVSVFGVSAYSGYFGAGAGVLIIAVLLLLAEADLARANALKNAILTMADLLPGVIFAIFGPVAWHAAIPLALGASIGGSFGPRVTRRMPRHVLRTLAALMGFGLAAWLMIQAG